MIRSKTWSSIGAAAVCLLFSSGAAFACDAPQYTFGLGLVQAPDPGHPSYAAAEIFKQETEASTQCAVQINLFPGGQMGGDREMFESIVIGTLDMGFISPAPISAFTNVLDGLSLPWLFDGDLALMHDALLGKPGETLRGAVDAETHTKTLGFIYSPFRNFVTTRPISDVKALQGIKLRTMQSALNVATFKAVGANPTPIPFPEVYGALQTRVVDGFETDVVGMYSGRFQEVAKYVARSGHFNNVPLIVMNQSGWEGLSADLQEHLAAAAIAASNLSYARSVAQVEEYTQRLMDAEVTFTELDVDALREATQGVYAEFEAKSDVTRQFVEQVNALKAQR